MAKVRIKAKASDKHRQSISAGSHQLVSDAPTDAGGDNSGPNPHELLLSALGACTSITLQMYAKRKGWDLQEVIVDLEDEEVEIEPGKKQPKISRHISVSGNLEPDQIDSLRTIADKCPIHKLLTGQKEVVTDVKRLTNV